MPVAELHDLSAPPAPAYPAETPVLCFVRDSFAWFTTRPLADQWADDWNDRYYQWNAGEPYEWRPDMGCPPYRVFKVAWEGPYSTPNQHDSRCDLSIQEINGGACAWLIADQYGSGPFPPNIPAGTSLEDFERTIRAHGGAVYHPDERRPSLQDAYLRWHKETFYPRSEEGVLRKIREEMEEFLANPCLEEAADITLCLMTYADWRRADLLDAGWIKYAKNLRRGFRPDGSRDKG